MEKRYQVFVSSTYEDLMDERLEVTKALLELDCIPCGMEYFPAANEDQWTYIKKRIDDCDYYIVIVGGKYGSLAPEGISYTEKEYKYAISRKMPTIAFTHHKPSLLSSEKKEKDPVINKNLNEFLELVKTKLCKDWRNADHLGAAVSRSLNKLIKDNPRPGWIKADKIKNEELLEEINNLRKENKILQNERLRIEQNTSFNVNVETLAFEEVFEIKGTYKHFSYGKMTTEKWNYSVAWKDIFKLIAPYLLQWQNDQIMNLKIAECLLKQRGTSSTFYSPEINDNIFQSLKVQFLALGLVQLKELETVKGGLALFWGLTPKGKEIMLKESSAKK